MNAPDQDDDLLEQVARQLEARKGAPLAASQPPQVDEHAVGSEPPSAEAAPAPAPESAPAPVAEAAEPTAPPATEEQEPEWMAALPPEAREQLQQLRGESTEAKRLKAEIQQLQANYGSLYNRLAPTQRELEQLRRQVQRPGSAPQAEAPTLSMDSWFKRLPKATQAFYEQYPEDRDAAFEAARAAVDGMAQHLQAETQRQLQQIRLDSERAQLQARHPDFQLYVQRFDQQRQQWVSPTRQAEDYWGWVNKQPEQIQALAMGSTAAENADALTLYKWEKDNPAFSQTLQSEPFQQWASAMPPRLTEMVFSPNLDERLTVLSYFWRDYEEANRGAAPPTPEANAAQQLAARRERQAERIAPSPRGTSAPTSVAAGSFDEDAAIEDVYQRMRVRGSRG